MFDKTSILSKCCISGLQSASPAASNTLVVLDLVTAVVLDVLCFGSMLQCVLHVGACFSVYYRGLLYIYTLIAMSNGVLTN